MDNDILKGVPAEEQLNVVRDAIRDMFPEGFERDGNHIDNTREGRGEFVRSKYSRALGKAEPGIHADKMRMAGNLDEIIQTSTNVENEKANHKNAESFNRGKVNVRVGANDYSVDVLTAIKNDGREVQYDLVNIQPTKINAPDADASEAFGDLRRTTAQSAETSRRGLPETPLRSAPETTVPEGTGSSQSGIPDTTVPQRDGQVNVEKAGESVESAQEYADVELHAEMENLDTDSWTRTEQMDTARQLTRRAQMSEKAVQTVVDNMPQGIGAQIYAPAAASLYRLGIDGHAETFEAALQKTGKGGLSGGVQQVLALGEAGTHGAEHRFFTGKGRGRALPGGEGGAAGAKTRQGGGCTMRQGIYYKADGSVSAGTKAEDAFIELSAKPAAWRRSGW